VSSRPLAHLRLDFDPLLPRPTKARLTAAHFMTILPDVPLLGDLYKVYVPRIRSLPKSRPLADADLAIDAFRIETHGELEIYYAPMD
jgi:hypothetical protein